MRRASAVSFRKVVAALIACGLAPVAMWAIGSATVRITPPVYRSEALLRLPEGSAAPGLSSPVIEAAARTLSPGGRHDPMAEQLLSSSLSLKPGTSPGLLRVAARGGDPEQARRTLMAVVESYERLHRADRGPRLLVYAAPMDRSPVAVTPGRRMALGVATLASLGLLLSIPLLRRLEGGQEWVNAIARASAAAGFPPGGGCLPAVRPAG